MRKFLVMMLCGLFATTMFLTSCGKDKKKDAKTDETTEVISYDDKLVGVGFYDVEKTLELDAEYMAMHYDKASLYEVQLFLDDTVDSTAEASVVRMKTIFQSGEKCVMVTHPTFAVGQEPKTIYEVHNGWWMECMPIEIPVKMGVSEMVTRLNEANIVKPHSNVVVLRKPLMPPFDKTLYIVGTLKSGFVSVNVDTKEVTPFK